MQYVIGFSRITAQNLLLLINDLINSWMNNQLSNVWPAYSTFVLPTAHIPLTLSAESGLGFDFFLLLACSFFCIVFPPPHKRFWYGGLTHWKLLPLCLDKCSYYNNDQPRRFSKVWRPFSPLAHVVLLVSSVYVWSRSLSFQLAGLWSVAKES